MTKQKKGTSHSAGHRIDRKARILQSALKCFIKNGVAQTKLGDIAAGAQVDQPLLTYYYPNLEILYVDVVSLVLEDLKKFSIDAIEEHPKRPDLALFEYIRVPFKWAQTKPGYFSMWMYFYYLCSHNPTFTDLNKGIRDTGRQRIAVLIYEGVERKIFNLSAQDSVAEMAFNVQGLISGNTILAGTEAGGWEAYANRTVEAVKRLLKYKEK